MTDINLPVLWFLRWSVHFMLLLMIKWQINNQLSMLMYVHWFVKSVICQCSLTYKHCATSNIFYIFVDKNLSSFVIESSNPAQARCTLSGLSTGWWFSPAMPVSSANKTDWHDITEILLKVALNTKAITVNHPLSLFQIKMIQTDLKPRV